MSHRQPIQSIAIGLLGGLLLLTGVVRADWQLSPASDPSRQWSATLRSGIGYDDNIDTSATKKENSLTEDELLTLDAKLPAGQTSGELRYTYEVTFYSDRPAAQPDQSHVLDANISHSFTPRLTASLSDSFRQGLEPALVGGLIERQRGDYTYNIVGASASYQLTPRWALSVGQSWDHWWFDEAAQAVTNNRDDYSTTVAATFSLDTRTSIGVNYSYSRTAYTLASTTNLVRDTDSQAVFVSFSHLFKPLVSVQADAGAQLAGFGSGSSDASPYLSVGTTYNYRVSDTFSAGASYNIQISEIAQFLSSDDLSIYLATTYHFTPKFYTALNFNYVIASYRNLNPLESNPYDITQKSSVEEDSWTLSLSLNYDFTPWCGAYAIYNHSAVTSGFDNPITGFLRSFDRNQYSVGLKLSY